MTVSERPNTGGGLTVTRTVSVETHPLALKPLTTYTVLAAGLATGLGDVRDDKPVAGVPLANVQ